MRCVPSGKIRLSNASLKAAQFANSGAGCAPAAGGGGTWLTNSMYWSRALPFKHNTSFRIFSASATSYAANVR